MLHELTRDDLSFDEMMTMRICSISRVDRILSMLDGPTTDEETVGGFCFTANIPYLIVVSRISHHR